jgi:hypothetical protein
MRSFSTFFNVYRLGVNGIHRYTDYTENHAFNHAFTVLYQLSAVVFRPPFSHYYRNFAAKVDNIGRNSDWRWLKSKTSAAYRFQ